MRATIGTALVAVTIATAGCHTMRVVTLDQLSALRPAMVRVTRADQTTVVVSGPRTFGDTLVGYVNGRFEEILATDLKQLMVRRPARGRTAMLLAAGVVGISALAYAVSSTGDFVDPQAGLDCEDDPYQVGCPLAP